MIPTLKKIKLHISNTQWHLVNIFQKEERETQMKKMRPKPGRKHSKYCSSMPGIWRSWWHIQFRFACLFRLFVSLFVSLIPPAPGSFGAYSLSIGPISPGVAVAVLSKQPILVAFPIPSGLTEDLFLQLHTMAAWGFLGWLQTLLYRSWPWWLSGI